MGFAEVKRVVLVSGAAEGETELNAFDNALLAAGIGDLNLIKVTSILPPHVEVVDEVPELPRGAFVPIVYTSVCSDVSGERIAAAVGIGRASDGFGVVMEASGHSQEEVEAEVAEFRATGEREVAGGAEFDWIDEDWENILQHPRVFAVIGHRESGKSALAHAILEYYVKKYNLKAYLVNTSGRPIPKKKLEALPKFITVVNSPDEIPVNAVVLYDEAYGRLHARTTHTSEAIMTDKLIELSRHKGWTLIYVTQESRKIDVNVLSGLDALFIKRPTDLRVSHERKEIRDVISEALRLFRKIRGNFREYVFVWSVNPDFEFKGMKRCGLPSYWNDELSKFYAGW